MPIPKERKIEAERRLLEEANAQPGSVNEYIKKKLEAARTAALDKSRTRDSGVQPHIVSVTKNSKQADAERTSALFYEATAQDIWDRMNAGEVGKRADPYYYQYYAQLAENARKKADELDKNPNGVYCVDEYDGAGCIYTATDNYGKNYRVQLNEAFFNGSPSNGFLQIPFSEVQPGDIVQDASEGVAGHAMVLNSKSEENGQIRHRYNWSRGGSTPDQYIKNGIYYQQADAEPYRNAFRFVGTPADSLRGKQEGESMQKKNGGKIEKYQQGRTINYSGINKNAIANLKYIDNALIKAGYGYIQRLAILGNVQRESGGNPLAVSSNGLGHGIIQGDKDRYRIQSNNEQEELQRQTNLLLKELEKKGWSGATGKDQLAYAQSFKDTSDLNQAVDIFTRRFVRPRDIEGEIKKRLAFAQSGFVDQEESDYDLETAKKVLPKNLINAGQRNPEKNHLPSGYTDDKGNGRALKSVYHPGGKEEMDGQSKPENMDEMLNYGYQEDYVSRFPVYKPFIKYQQGGMIYQGFYEKAPKYKQDELAYGDFDVFNSRFPIEPVMIYTPQKETSTNVEESPIIEETTFAPLIQKGTVEYKSKDIDLGNMKELVELMRDEGISFRITSGSRPGSKTSNGSISHHSSGNALDITPIEGQSGDDLINQMRKSKKFISYMREHKLGILDERSKKMQARTGATGAHFHIGPDLNAIANFNLMFGK